MRALIAIADSANLEEVTITDTAGNVTASTNLTLVHKSIVLPKNPPLKAEVTTESGRITVLRAIALGGDNVMGVLRIVAKDGG